MIHYELSFYLAAIPAILLVGISKGGFGGGLGMIAVPLMALVISPIEAAAIMLPILCLMDMVTLWHFRGKAAWQHLKILLPAATLGIGLGTLGFHYLSVDQLKLIIGTIAVAFVAHRILKAKSQQQQQANLVKGSFWGMLAGFTSFSVHAGGPALSIYLLPLRLDKTLFVGTTVIFFAGINLIKLGPYFWLGQFNSQTLMTALILAPLAPLGVKTGNWLHHRIDERWFYLMCYIMLAVTGVKLIWDGLTGML